MSGAGSTHAAERRLSQLVTVLAFALPVVFVLVPLAIFLVYSFFSVDQGTIVHSPTLGNYVRFFTDPIFLPVFWNTIVLCVSVAVICILLAYPAAYFLTTLKGRWRYALLMLLLVPLLMSYVIKIYAIRSILGLNGFLNKALVALGILDQPSTLFVFNMNAILLTLSLLLIPFAILPIFLSLERIPQTLLRASDDLGASSLQTFLRITLPLSLPGVASAASFVFVLAIGDFLTPQMVGGISGFTFGRILYSQFGTAYNWPFGAALSVALAIVVIAAILIGERFGRSRGTSV
ncbi:ABC transporter permease [Mesorhizobium sp. M8A.F.Ca.ET.202.01.1.1]|uniref:ABC transporter permease n=1 Tax=Mesorhizobium sp. M8A.F.Ca.ET.198.01.1.1 TaxID=2563966 RepID=UPI000FD913F2|nr:ABC transporter permease [Mesorhizobium sp. M8A.F.Ca.ET.198.01.1.1]TGR27398.1 ABC transporter permease [Mesorhizobium sp. M8A.F.Ca.ET.202.01.1.1]TGR28415.1 ABC transporter permease [Mesorhizobium sp. M8A.F.Ca.ET.197.01.1.1]TGR44244.1 ABC transporter permease [bacterium M00.F.Ca.ET.199.01.1.1]TGU33109.1 ABC transporter permease [bacterium M00.F.Ca.ET.156.01.1.1]TGV87314.1 ABC transporter permease [Mesorhizobium sp. M00.F.Ca.ET.149.01.1.1]TIT53067.1 MAG: ABC transporter permease subunit [Mes